MKPTAPRLSPPGALAILVLACVLLSGCAPAMDSARRASAKRIGVLSLLGDQPISESRGVTIFENRRGDTTGADFQVDTAVCDAMSNSLRAGNSGAQIINLRPDRDTVRLPGGEVKVSFASELDLTQGSFSPELGRIAQQLATRHRLDIVVIAAPRQDTRETGYGVPKNAGYGLSGPSLFGIPKGDARLFANYAFGAYDGLTGKQLAFRNSSPIARVDEVDWKASYGGYTPAERATLTKAMRDMFAEDTAKRLGQMGLTR